MLKKVTVVLVILCMLLTTGSLIFGAAPAGFKVVGYMPSWQGDVNQIQYSKVTHINYSFVIPNSNGSLQAVENPSKLSSLVSLAHANGKKVCIAVGGWNGGNDSAFEALAANSTYRTNFVNNMVNFVNQYGLDGVDIDWEYPDPGTSASNYAALMSQLSTAMHSRGKLLTAAVIANGYQGEGVPSSVFGYVDWINIMSYDGGSGASFSPYQLAVDSLNYWVNRGLPRSKAIVGVPFYGSAGKSYKDLVRDDSQAPYKDYSSGQYYNGINTIKSKTNFAMANGGGIMIWELSQDTNDSTSLLKAINDAMAAYGGFTPPPSGAPIGKTIWLNAKSTNTYVSAWVGGTNPLQARATSVNTWEKFYVQDAGNGYIALKALSNNLFVSANINTTNSPLQATASTVQDWERFTWTTTSDGYVGLKAKANNNYVTAWVDSANYNPLQARSGVLNDWEKFTWGQ